MALTDDLPDLELIKPKSSECDPGFFDDGVCAWLRCIVQELQLQREDIAAIQLELAEGGGNGGNNPEIKGSDVTGDGSQFEIYNLTAAEVSQYGNCFASAIGTIEVCGRINTNDSGGFNGPVSITAQRLVSLICDNGSGPVIVAQETIVASGTSQVNIGSGSNDTVCATSNGFALGPHTVDLNDTCVYSIAAGPVNGSLNFQNNGNVNTTTVFDDGDITACLSVQCT